MMFKLFETFSQQLRMRDLALKSVAKKFTQICSVLNIRLSKKPRTTHITNVYKLLLKASWYLQARTQFSKHSCNVPYKINLFDLTVLYKNISAAATGLENTSSFNAYLFLKKCELLIRAHHSTCRPASSIAKVMPMSYRFYITTHLWVSIMRGSNAALMQSTECNQLYRKILIIRYSREAAFWFKSHARQQSPDDNERPR